jgi:DNA-directed RNA polymerase specialized sigma subunit
MLHAVITGDIVSSGKINPATRQKLFEAIDGLMKNLKKKLVREYETYRGDSLQCTAASPEKALRIALIIRSFLRAYSPISPKSKMIKKKKKTPVKGYFTTSFDIRLAIGIGKADFINKRKISSSDGEAFRFSGNTLDKLKQNTQRMAIKTCNKNFDQQTEPAILLLDGIIQKWTQNQAELVYYKLQTKKEDEIANLLGISQSAVNQRTKTAQWYAIEKLIQYFEATIQNWIK